MHPRSSTAAGIGEGIAIEENSLSSLLVTGFPLGSVELDGIAKKCDLGYLYLEPFALLRERFDDDLYSLSLPGDLEGPVDLG